MPAIREDNSNQHDTADTEIIGRMITFERCRNVRRRGSVPMPERRPSSGLESLQPPRRASALKEFEGRSHGFERNSLQFEVVRLEI